MVAHQLDEEVLELIVLEDDDEMQCEVQVTVNQLCSDVVFKVKIFLDKVESKKVNLQNHSYYC
jgi:hypothetical protein